MDLRDLWRPGGGPSGLTFRRVKLFVDRLPPESATKTAIRDDMGEQNLAQLAAREPDAGYGPWSWTDMRLAALIDKVSWLAYAIYHSQGGKPSTPEPYPRPGVPRKREGLTPEQFAYLTALRERNHAAWAQQRAETEKQQP